MHARVAATAIALFAPLAVAQSKPDLPVSDAEWAAAADMRRFGIAEPLPKADTSVRIAHFNIENLFDAVDDPALTGREDDKDMTKPRHEREAVARLIRRLDADVLCLGEVESLEALTWFRDEFLADMGYDHAVSLDAGGERGIEQGLLSRFPAAALPNWPGKQLGGIHPEKYGDQENWYAGQPIAFRRSPLAVDITIPAGARGNDADYSLTAILVHHKSGQHSGYWREAEAKGVLAIVDGLRAEHPDRNILVLGDFNAEPGAKSIEMYLNANFTDLGAAFSGERSGDALITHDSARRIDLILASPQILPELVAESCFVLGGASRPEGVNWRDLPTFAGYGADHHPIAIDLTPVETRVDTPDAPPAAASDGADTGRTGG
jgi:endonuclease/exonuclease/phosphatase family metal-dependent hydrolase